MTREALLDDVRARIEFHLLNLEASRIPGSVIAAVHCDSHGARKVVVSVEESWPIPRD